MAQIAFFAGLTSNLEARTANSPIVKFDNVVTNVGCAFNHDDGIFTAPLDGTYHFTVVIAADSGTRAVVDFMKGDGRGNNGKVFSVWTDSILKNWSTSTYSAILDLNKGSKVFLQMRAELNNFLYGGMYTSFSGHCLFTNTKS